MLTTHEELKESGSKIISAKEKKIEIVTEEWIIEKTKNVKPKVKQPKKEGNISQFI